MAKAHIVTRDYGTHISTLCGSFHATLEQAMAGKDGMCANCKKKFLQTKEQIAKHLQTLKERDAEGE